MKARERRRGRALLCCAAVAATVALASGVTAQTATFDGLWVYDPAQSVSPHAAEGLQLRVKVAGSRISVSRFYPDVPQAGESYACAIDGGPGRSSRDGDPVTWKVRREGQSLVWRAERTVASRGTVKWTERWSLSRDGKTLTIDRSYQMSAETARAVPALAQIREVFRRQPAGRRGGRP